MSFFSRKDPPRPPPDLTKKEDEKGSGSKIEAAPKKAPLGHLRGQALDDAIQAMVRKGEKERAEAIKAAVVGKLQKDAGAGGGGGGGGGAGTAKLPIQIRTMDGKTYKIEAKTDWDVQRLKQEFERWHGGNAATCSLFYKAKKLQDNNTLLSYKIGAGDFVMANYRSLGGLQV